MPGGLAACRHGVDVRHLWGMTELSPLGSLGTLTSGQMGDGLTHADTITLKVRFESKITSIYALVREWSCQRAEGRADT
jgi:hypothetical protein